MKQFKPVLITLAVLIVISVAALVIVNIMPEKEAGEPSDLDISYDYAVKLLDCTAEEVLSIEITPREGKAITIENVPEGIKLRGEDESLKFDENRLKTTLAYLTPLGTSEEIGEDDGSSFGLSDPRLTFSVNLKNGERVTFLVGEETPLGDGSYIRRADSGTVYTINESVQKVLFMKREDYRDFTLFTEPREIAEVKLSRPSKPELSVRYKTEEELEKSAQYSSNYMVTAPVFGDAHVENIHDLLIDKIIGTSAIALIEDHPKDLVKYGLNNPTKVYFKDSDGNTVTLLVGKRTENGGSYVMREGVPSVVETASPADFKELSHADLITSLVWIFNSDDVKKVTYKTPNETHTLELEYRDGLTYGKFDGKEMTGKNPTHLYIHTIRFSIAGELEKGVKYKDAAMTITIELESGKTETLELCEINERQYAAVRNGKSPEFYINVTELRELINCFEILKNGGDIPAIV